MRLRRQREGEHLFKVAIRSAARPPRRFYCCRVTGETILGARLPMVVTFLLGFVAARQHEFGSKDASTLNRMVLLYAVPLALFAGTVTTSRTALGKDIPLVIALCIAIIGFYGVVFLFSHSVFRM